MDASDSRVYHNSPLAALVRRARLRHVSQIVVDELALTLSIVFGGAILLLVFGTQILDWYWLVALLAVGLGLGTYRARKRLRSQYEIARTVDANLGLNDVLSTAFYFTEHPASAKSTHDIVERQRQMAQEAARSADLNQGLPWAISRSAYASSMLALAAVSIFGLRYGVTRRLDLRPSLVAIAFEGFLGPSAQHIADGRKKIENPQAKDWKNPATLKYDPWEAQTLDQKGAPDAALSTIDTPNVDNSNNTGPAADPKADGKESNSSPDSTAENENSERSSGNPEQSPEGSQAPTKDGSNKAGTPPPGANQKGQNAENSSLTDKMKDALANLLSKLKMQPKGGSNKSGGQQQNQPGQQQSAQNHQNQNGAQMKGQPQTDPNGSPDGQPSPDAQGTEQAKSGQGKSNGKNDERSNSQDGKSGIGRQDGDKSVKEAEQLAAMGKISEIIGKRSQNVTGEVMVEVASGSQQLRTQYSQKKAAHTDTGGEISRDEVPLAYQQYVQAYFEEIRKMPVAKAGKKAEAKKSGPS